MRKKTESWAWVLEAMKTDILKTDEFRKAWEDWARHRAERKPKLTRTSVVRQIRRLEKLGHDRAVAAIDHSIASGYQGIWEPREATQQPPPGRISGKPGKYAKFD